MRRTRPSYINVPDAPARAWLMSPVGNQAFDGTLGTDACSAMKRNAMTLTTGVITNSLTIGRRIDRPISSAHTNSAIPRNTFFGCC